MDEGGGLVGLLAPRMAEHPCSILRAVADVVKHMEEAIRLIIPEAQMLPVAQSMNSEM